MSAERMRRAISGSINDLVIGSPTMPAFEHDPDDPGPVPLDSPIRTVHADPAMFIGGVRALVYQTLHPVAIYAVSQHSEYETDPLGRLQRTAYFLAATVFGSGTQAQHAVDRVKQIHSSVTGQMPDGSLYRADDPHLLGWVHATEVDSFLRAYQTYGPNRLTSEEADRYVADMAIVGAALGADELPYSRAELAAVLDMYQAEARPTPECRDATRFLFAPQLPITMLPFYGLIFSAAVGSLPAWARSMLLLPVAPGIDPLVLRPAARMLTHAIRWAGPGYRR